MGTTDQTISVSSEGGSLGQVFADRATSGSVVDKGSSSGNGFVSGGSLYKSPKAPRSRFPFWATGAILLVLLGVGLYALNSKKTPSASNKIDKSSLNEVLKTEDLSFGGSTIKINGTLQVGRALFVAPSAQPSGARPGEIYYDQATNQLAYYNGSNFVFLNEAPQPGIQSIVAGSSNVTVSTDASGVATISVDEPAAAAAVSGGQGTVTSNGGTAGTVPLFTASQNIEDSILTQSGTAMTVGGGLNVSGSLGLGTALAVTNGGTGASSLAANGVLVGQGTSAISSLVAGSAGLCLLSTSGAPSWGACSGGGGGVTSLNSLTGALSIANASGAGSTITIDNASTSAKGIASFNASNFSVSSGAVNTIQNIGTGATPTFAGVNTNTITPSGAFTLGATGQAFTVQGSAASTITATSGGNTTTISFATPTAARAVVVPNESGTICLQGSSNCGFLTSGDTNVAKLNATQTFTGVNTFQNTVNSGNAFRVLTAAGSSLLNVDTSEGELELGQGSSVTGTILFRNAANGFVVTLAPSVQTNHRTITLPDEDGTLCMRNSTSCGFILNTTSPQTANISITGNAVIGGNITVNGHIISGGSTPAIAAGAAACSSPTVNVSGKDTAGLITVTTGTSCGAGGKLATITFASAFGAAPRVVLTAAETNAAGLHYFADSGTISTTAFDLTTQAGDTIGSTTTYKWYYHVIQ